MSQKLEKFHKYLNLYQKLIKKNAGQFVDGQLAEDVAQETFIKMYEHLDYLDDGMVKQWLIVVSGNIAKDYSKKGGKYETDILETGILAEFIEDTVESAEESYENSIKKKAALKLLQTALNVLYEKNPDWYYVMLDYYYLGMSSTEIAKVIGSTPGNVDVIKSRARKYLHKKLGKEFRDYF